MVDEAREAPSRRTVRRDSRRIAAERTPEERRRRRIALIIIGAMLLVITGIIVAGYVIIFVLPPQQLVVRVNDVVYTRGDMVKLLRLRQRSMELAQTQQIRTSDDVFEALQLIVENEVIAQAAPSDGIAVSRDEIDNAIRARIAPSPDESLGKSNAQIEREYHERYRQFLNQAQVSEGEHRDLVRKSILREKYRQFLGDQVPAFAEQVYLHRIAMGQNDEIDIMQTKLKDSIGDNTSPEYIRGVVRAIAREFSSDPETYESAGDVGWVPLGIIEDYEDKFWQLEPGVISKPTPNVDNPQQVLFFVVSERDGNREVSRANRESLKTRTLQIWVNQERQNHDVYATFNSDIYAWFIEQLRISAATTPTPVSDPLQNILSGL